jgi:fucose 4-O-acetylase-like acetyltransferase
MLKVILVSWVIGGHALLGYAALGGGPYDEVAEATIPPRVELVLSVIFGPTALFVIGTFFFLAGMFAPAERTRLGAGGFVRHRLVRLGRPWLAFVVLVWPLSMWLAYRAAGHDVLPGRRSCTGSRSSTRAHCGSSRCCCTSPSPTR